MVIDNDKKRNISDSVSLLISILVRYPEVATINFDQENKVLKFTFIITGIIDEMVLNDFKKGLINSTEVYNMLENQKPTILEINEQLAEDFTLLEVKRDVATLTKEEISLYISLLRIKFNKSIVAEMNEMLEEDLLMQEELIEHMLENIKFTNQDNSLIAFREEGKVLVFNK